MIRPSIAAPLAALLLFGCGAPQVEEKKPGADTTKTSQQRITNINQSDLAGCFPKQPEIPATANKEVLTGLLVAGRPEILECLVDPKNRGANKETKVTVKSSIKGGAIENAVSGDNLTPDGQKCVQGAIDKWLAGVPDLAKKAGSAEVTAELQVAHINGVTPTVQLGVNEGSDVAGTVRLAQGSWCDCYADWKDAPPRTLKAKIHIVKHGTESEGAKSVSAADVAFEPTQDAAADKVAACLQKKVMELKFTVTSEELTLPYSFIFVNSSHSGPLGPEANPDTRFAQLDGVRSQRAAATVIAIGARGAAATVYDGLVAKYKANSQSVAVDELKAKCADLLKADDGWISSLEQELDIDQKTLDLAKELKAKDPEWARAEELAQRTFDTTNKDLDAAKKGKASDTGICPRERQERK